MAKFERLGPRAPAAIEATPRTEGDRLRRVPRLARSPLRRLAAWLGSRPSEPLFVADPRARIFLLSLAILFFELLCIRWIPAYVRYLSYFNTFNLLASCLGIGLGMLAARRRGFWFLPFPLLVPLERLLLDQPLARYVLASGLAFAPVFLANVIFSNAFRDAEQADVAFACNLLGIMVGGRLEYLSLLLGHHLLLPSIGCSLSAMLLRQGRLELSWLPGVAGGGERSSVRSAS